MKVWARTWVPSFGCNRWSITYGNQRPPTSHAQSMFELNVVELVAAKARSRASLRNPREGTIDFLRRAPSVFCAQLAREQDGRRAAEAVAKELQEEAGRQEERGRRAWQVVEVRRPARSRTTPKPSRSCALVALPLPTLWLRRSGCAGLACRGARSTSGFQPAE